LGFEDLHWVKQSLSTGFAVIYHDAEAAHNPRCRLFLQKKDLGTGEVVEDVNVKKALHTVLEILDSSELINCKRIADKNNHSPKHGTPPSVVLSLSNRQADSPESNSSGSTSASPESNSSYSN